MRRILLLALVVATATTALVSGVATAATPSPLNWGACPADAAAPGLECSTLQVPLDYRNPDGRKIDLEISRIASKNPAQRRGVLLTNPGGPGIAGLKFPTTLVDVLKLPQSVRDTYDLIGLDPRGVGHSTPVTCDLTPEQKTQGLNPPYAQNSADVAKQAEVAKAEAKRCATSETASMLPYLTTASTARDLDKIREALGEPKISYYGGSYGTYLGAVYTTLFPGQSDRIVLDSNLGPDGLDSAATRRFALGVQERFPDFAEFVAKDPSLGLGSTPAQVTAKYYELAARLDKTPVQGANGSLFRQATFGLLYSDTEFPLLAQYWQSLDTNQPSGTSAALAEAASATADASSDNDAASYFAVICNDSRWSRSVSTYQRDVALDRVRYPMFGAAAANIRPCAFWPSAPAEPKVRIGDQGPSNVLMVQNLRDPGTPLAGARQLRRAFGGRARMVTVDQGGHGVYLEVPNQCANNAVTGFLTTGKRTSHDFTCAAESS